MKNKNDLPTIAIVNSSGSGLKSEGLGIFAILVE